MIIIIIATDVSNYISGTMDVSPKWFWRNRIPHWICCRSHSWAWRIWDFIEDLLQFRLTTRQSSRRASEWVHGSEGIILLGCEENAGLPLWSRPQTNMQSLAAKGQIGIKVGAIYLVQQDMSQQSPSSTKSIVDGDRATGPHVQAERLKGSVRVPNARPHCSVTISASPWHRDNCS